MAIAFVFDAQGNLRQEFSHWAIKSPVTLALLGEVFDQSVPETAPKELKDKIR